MDVPQQQLIRPFRNISQSWMHMVLYYYCLRFDMAVGILRECPRDQWPKDWFEILGNEIDLAAWFLASYAPRQTVPPPVAICWSDLINQAGSADHMELTIRAAEPLDWDLFEEIRTILPDWHHQHSRPTFGMDHPWWVGADVELNNIKEYNNADWALYRAHKYFNECWPEYPSPLHERHNLEFDVLGYNVLDELKINFNELKAVEDEMREAWRHLDLLRQ